MARDFAPDLTAVGEALEETAGLYLKSVRRDGDHLCQVCALPVVAGRTHCYQCGRHATSGVPLTDRVGTLIYAVEDLSLQAYLTVRNYKAPLPGPSLVHRMRELLAVGLRGHTTCLGTAADTPVSAWAVVPSRRGRTQLRDLVLEIAKDPAQEIEVSVQADAPTRTLAPASWPARPDGQSLAHVLVIDDSWVSGASAQSVASSLKASGAENVSILTVARILKPTLSEISGFVLDILPALEFDWRRCPWTLDGICPTR